MKKKISPIPEAEPIYKNIITRNPLKSKVSQYRHSKDNIGTTTTILDELMAIKSGKNKEIILRGRACPDAYVKLKPWLTMTCFQGYFKPTRSKSNLVEPSGIMSADFDDMLPEQAIAVRDRLKSSPYIVAAWVSPSGHGVKALIRADITNDEECKQAFRDISVYFQQEYNLIADPQCKDVCRTTFRSFDPDLWVNQNTETFIYSKVEPVAARKPEPIIIPIRSNPKLEGYVLSAINGELSNIASAPAGEGTRALYRAAIHAGELSFTGLFCREAIEAEFVKAFLSRKNSLNTEAHALTVFSNGWNLGITQPRQLPSEVLL